MKLILLGAPGAGKGTQAARISALLNIPAVSTGDMIREEVASGSGFGQELHAYIQAGKLVPDSLVESILEKRLRQKDCEKGFILDGFPRTLEQAKYLDSIGQRPDRVINIEVPDASIVRRLGGRRVCSSCKKTCHTVHSPPRKEGACDACGAALVQREDDKAETVLKRLAVYHQETEPLTEHYKDRLITVGGERDPAEITARVLEILNHDHA